MKNIIIILVLLHSLNLNGQTNDIPLSEKKLSGPLGLNFGISVEKVKLEMKNKGAVLDVKMSKTDKLVFNKFKVGPKMADILIFGFVDNKLFDFTAIYLEKEAKLQECYDLIKEPIDNKYGSGESYRNFKSPYYDGDGYEMQAIRSGKGSISSYWIFKNASISLEITENMDVLLRYQDSDLAELYFERKKSKEASDL